jgi:hypothetical protein
MGKTGKDLRLCVTEKFYVDYFNVDIFFFFFKKELLKAEMTFYNSAIMNNKNM